jgi:hypothetical protein
MPGCCWSALAIAGSHDMAATDTVTLWTKVRRSTGGCAAA